MALSAESQIEEKDGILRAMPVAADIIYKGALCTWNSAGYLAPAGLAASERFAGIAMETVDNSGGNAGDKTCRVQCEGRYLLTGSGLSQSDVGSIAYAADDATISTTAGTDAPIGIIDEFVSATQVWVKLNPNGDVAASS